MNEIYLDNAATSWPKPEEVYRAVETYMRELGGTPARGRHRKAIAADSVLGECRTRLARLLHTGESHLVVLTSGATESLNLAIQGILDPGSHVVLTDLEHNSVVRPLSALLRERNVRFSVVRSEEDGGIDPEAVRRAVRPETRLVCCTHASNVLGTVVDVAAVARAVHEAGALILVDAAQTVGVREIDVGALGIDLLAFTGHKSLLGPPGTGGLVFRKDLDLRPLKRGGTGTFSLNPEQPDRFPDRYESGSPNMYGIAGLGAGLAFLEGRGTQSVGDHKTRLVARLREGLSKVPGIRLYGSAIAARSAGIVAFNLKGEDSESVAHRLWEKARVMVRAGHHCAPFLHPRLGTEEQGVVRVGIGYSTSSAEIGALVETLT